jgi:hypothetical protein
VQLIDERGRLLGKVNLIDAIVGVFVLLLVPLAYGAFVLFRVPAPTIAAIEPTTVTQGQATTLKITGRDLRPFLRARVGATESLGFFVESPTRAEIKLPALTAGAYDLALYDQAQELLRVPDAVRVVSVGPVGPSGPRTPRTEVQVVGTFVGLAEDEAPLIRAGLKLGTPARPVAEVLAVGEAQSSHQRIRVGSETILTPVTSGELQKAALLRLTCLMVDDECRVGERPVARNVTVTLPLPVHLEHERADGERLQQVRFFVEDVHPANIAVTFPPRRVERVEAATPVATVRARFTVRPEVMSLVEVGDAEAGGPPDSVGLQGAQLVGIDSNRETLTAVTTVTGLERGVRRTYDVEQPVTTFTATLHVPVVRTPTGWRYRDRSIKVGVSFSFETLSYFMDGWILDVRLEPDDAWESR